MRCSACGKILPEDSLFCQYCGKNLGEPKVMPAVVQECLGEETPVIVTESRKAAALTTDENIPPAKKSQSKGSLIALCAIAAAVLAVCLGIGTMAEPDEELDIAAIAESVLYLEMYDKNGEVLGSASGFLVNDQTSLVTNYHVIQDACSLRVWTSDETESVEVTRCLAYDEVADLALLECEPGLSVQHLTLDDSDLIRRGDSVYAVGYPLGLANTLSDGIVSSRYEDTYGNDILQVTAAISEGNSGGPLLTRSGRVIGVICAYYIDGQNLNIAIASNTLRKLLESERKAIPLESWENRPLMPDQELTEEPESEQEQNPEIETKPVEPAKPESAPPPAEVKPPVEELPPQQPDTPAMVTAYTFLSDWIVANSNTAVAGDKAYREMTTVEGFDAAFTVIDCPQLDMICVSMELFGENNASMISLLWLEPDANSFDLDYYFDRPADSYSIKGSGTMYAATPYGFMFSQYEGEAEVESLNRDTAVSMCLDMVNFVDYIFYANAVPKGYHFSSADFGFST